MKKTQKLLFSIFFVFAFCLSAGLIVIFAGQEKNEPLNTDKDVAVAASTSSASIKLSPVECYYNSINSDGSISSQSTLAVNLSDARVYYHNNWGSDKHKMGNLSVPVNKKFDYNAVITEKDSSFSASGSYSISIGILSQKERRFGLSVDISGNEDKVKDKIKLSGLVVIYFRGQSYIKDIYINEDITNTSLTISNSSFSVASNTESDTVLYIYPRLSYTYTLSSTLKLKARVIEENCGIHYVENSSIVNDFEEPGYSLKGFYTKSSGGEIVIERNGNNWVFKTFVEPGAILYAQYTPYTYKVNFHANGGSGSMSAQDFKYGTAQNLKSNSFTKKGYSFKGWATSSSGGVVYSNNQSVNNLTTTQNGSINLYAVWEINKYYVDVNHYLDNINQSTNANTGFTFSVKVNGSVSKTNVSDFFEEITYDSSVEIYDIKYNGDIRYSGYVLTDWSAEVSGSTSKNIKIKVLDKRVDVNLQFVTVDKFSLVINDGVTTHISAVKEKNLVSLQVPKRQGYIFTGWSVSGSGYVVEPQYLKEEKNFNGTSDYINIGRSHMYSEKFLFSTWAYMDNWSEYGVSDTSMRIVSCTESGGWNIESNSGNICCAIYEYGKGYNSLFSNKKWSSLTSGWHNFILTFDGQKGTLFIDNEKIQETPIFNSNKVGYNSTNSMLIGAEVGSGSSPVGSYFKGKIKDVIIINDCAFGSNVESYFSDSSMIDFGYYFLAGNSDTTITANWVETWAAVGKDVTLKQDASGAYLISSAEELGKVAYMVNFEDNDFAGETIRLANNIDLAGKYWIPIGILPSVSFKGTRFDGDDYVIRNLTTYSDFENAKDKTYFEYSGLFGNVENTTINNLRLESANITGLQYVGGIAGNCNNNVVIENCLVGEGSITSTNNYSNTGGIAGVTNGIVRNCVNYATIKTCYGGGITGRLLGGKISSCINYGTIENNDEGSDYYYGGIAGRSVGNGVILENCINYGDVFNYKSVDGTAGIIGSTEGENTVISSCANYGNIIFKNGSSRFSGAIVARNYKNDLLIENCSSNCEMSGKGSVATWVSVLCGGESGVYVKSSYASMTVAGERIKHAYGNAEDFNDGFRYAQGINNNLPMQVTLFEYAKQISKQTDVLATGLAGFERL